MEEIKNILIVEDEAKVAMFIKKGLKTQGWESEIAHEGSEAINLFNNYNFDLVILDIGLPDMSGLDVCKMLRNKNSKVPILMLTAMGSLSDKLSGFEVGTDDYLVKPFDFMELLVRVKALLKRSINADMVTNTLNLADLELDLELKIARRGGQIIELTAREYLLLEFLMRSHGRVCSKIDIADKVWDINFDRGTNYVEVYINYLQNKVDKPFETKLIHTVVGMGYTMKVK
jgi:two-component system, OmpR family, copper resistance phosphate regulon response regulator CusR